MSAGELATHAALCSKRCDSGDSRNGRTWLASRRMACMTQTDFSISIEFDECIGDEA
jgi:hypothetical protein